MAVELIPGGVDSACHPSEVGKMSASLLLSCVGVVTHPGLCPIAKETASATLTLCTEYGPNLFLLLVLPWMRGVGEAKWEGFETAYKTARRDALGENGMKEWGCKKPERTGEIQSLRGLQTLLCFVIDCTNARVLSSFLMAA